MECLQKKKVHIKTRLPAYTAFLPGCCLLLFRYLWKRLHPPGLDSSADAGMDNMELKPCPFCGGKAKISQRENWFYPICCNDKCVAFVPFAYVNMDGGFISKEDATNAWNNRV